jgi:hypothetical protein
MEWKPVILECLRSYVKNLELVSTNAITYVCKTQKVFNHFVLKSNTLIQDLSQSTQKELEEYLFLELRPYTLNHYIFDILIKLRVDPLMNDLNELGEGQVEMAAVKGEILTN